MDETIDALGHKTDVKARVSENVGGKVDAAKERLGMGAQKAGEMTPDPEQVGQQARRAAGLAQENPLGLAIGAAAIGFIGGLLMPSSRMEDERIGPMADQVRDQAKQTGQEALERGKQVAQSAAETAREEGREQGSELTESTKQKAQEMRHDGGG
jgi:hypothetical protein